MGMATTKITVTVEDDQLRQIRALVEAGQSSSVSGFVKHAIGIALFDPAGWRQMLRSLPSESADRLAQLRRRFRNTDSHLSLIRLLPPVLIACPLGLAPKAKSSHNRVGIIAGMCSRGQGAEMLRLAATQGHIIGLKTVL